MKIAFFSDCYLDLTGGIVTSINAQKQALEANGHEVVVFSTAYPKTTAELKKLANDHVYVVPSCKYLIRGATPISHRPRIVERWLLKNHPEIKDFDIYYIHYEAGCSIAGLRLGRKLKIPTVQVMHGREDVGEESIIPPGLRTIVAVALNWSHSWYLPHKVKVRRDNYLAKTIARAKMWTLMVNHANYADLVLTPSEHFRKKLLHYGVIKPVKVFPNGYPDANFPERPPIKELKPGEPLKIIWHSRLYGEKRIMEFLEAIALVTGKYHVDVYGDGADLKKAMRFCKKHNLSVKFHGNAPFSKVQTAIDQAHLDVLVSYDYDTFGMTLIEAEAHGTPVLFCDPNMVEIVPPKSYVLSADETSAKIASAIDGIIEHPDRIRTMSQIMLDHRHEVLISHRIKALEKLFNDIIKK